MSKIPSKLINSPIVEAITEVRFSSDVPHDAIIGIIYNSFKKQFPKLDRLPLLSVPEQIRSSDKTLILQPLYKLDGKDYSLQVGPKLFSLVTKNQYPGWTKYLEELKIVFEAIIKLTFIRKFERLGMRYINFFEGDIIDKCNFSLTLYGSPHSSKELYLQTVKEEGRFKALLQISNSAKRPVGVNDMKSGSVIDIDVSSETLGENFSMDYQTVLIEAHELQKKLFFSLLKDEFITTLKPEYK